MIIVNSGHYLHRVTPVVGSAGAALGHEAVDGFKAGQSGRHVHLGYWDVPPSLVSPCTTDEFDAAQARLCDIFLGLADLEDRQCVLDVGCGFDGTLAAVNDR
jgi:hypothetical protein